MTSEELGQTALDLLKWLVEHFGAQLVMAAFGVVSGSTAGMAIEDVSLFVTSLLTTIRSQVTDDKIKAILETEYNAADATVDIVEKAKFG